MEFCQRFTHSLTRLPLRQQIIQDLLRDGQNLLGQFGDEVLGKLLERVSAEAGQGLGDGGAEADRARLRRGIEIVS